MSCERMMIMVLMPTGVYENFQCHVIDGTKLEFTMNWPISLYNVEEMHQPLYKVLTKQSEYGNFLFSNQQVFE